MPLHGATASRKDTLQMGFFTARQPYRLEQGWLGARDFPAALLAPPPRSGD